MERQLKGIAKILFGIFWIVVDVVVWQIMKPYGLDTNEMGNVFVSTVFALFYFAPILGFTFAIVGFAQSCKGGSTNHPDVATPEQEPPQNR